MSTVLFRGWMFKKLQRLSSARWAIGIVTVLTAAIFPHGFGIVLAFLSCWLCCKTKSVWASFTVNVAAAVFVPLGTMADKLKLLFPTLNSDTTDVLSTYIQRRNAWTDPLSVMSNLWQYARVNIVSILLLAAVSAVSIWYVSRMPSDDAGE
ncbi:MAG: CPBP family intramembrane metalloprotease [Clostridiales bacterium]|jgi:hypothetical protein|nr:CPBP family intramembrane metalloprotease [Clostridiales bacterium]